MNCVMSFKGKTQDPYPILKHKQCKHFSKTILNWQISRVKNHVKRKIISFNFQCYQYNDYIS